MPPVISVENLSKSYRLGVIGTGTFSNDLKVWWARTRGKPNPMLKIGQEDNAGRAGETLWALKDVTFQVKQGEVLGIIGRNGAGKSTLLKILSRVTAPTSGSVKVKGRIASLLEVGTGFHPELTGRENIYLNGAILGMTKTDINRRFDEIVEFAEIAKFIDTPVKRYSSGMYVRLAFAVAAHLESEILLVDEVLAVGDAEFQKKCLGKMGDVASKEGRTVLFVSHNMGSIQQMCENVALINTGKLVEYGESTRVISDYLDKSQRLGIIKKESKKIRFLGLAPLNLRINDDVSLKLPFLVGQEDVEKAKVNLAVNNENGICVMRLQSEMLKKDFSLPNSSKVVFNFDVKTPHLAPGKYSIDLHVTDRDSILFYSQGIPAFIVEGIPLAEHNKVYYDRVGVIVPVFSLTCSRMS